MTTETGRRTSIHSAVDVVAVTVTVPYHLELAIAAFGAGNHTTRRKEQQSR